MRNNAPFCKRGPLWVTQRGIFEKKIMSEQQMKIMAAQAALKHITSNMILGVGTGSTVNCFIDLLATVKDHIKATVASSQQTAKLLKARGFEVIDLNTIDELPLYVDGADSYNHIKQLVKGGGALTKEKILATVSEKFICIVDQTKPKMLDKVPMPIEVIPMARSYVAREIVKLGGQPSLRENFITDNGNIILDVYNWEITQPIKLEMELNNIPGIVESGLFAVRNADQIIIGHNDFVEILD